VYDFTDHTDAAASGGPSRLLTALELPRVVGEYGASRLLDTAARVLPPPLAGGRVGEDRPVLVLPGFAANDRLTGRLRSHLAQRGFRQHGWRLGSNHGLTERIVDGLPDQLEVLAEHYGQPISLVGWSFGGLLARWLAHTHPDGVRQVVTLGSPWRPEGEQTRATAMFERSRARNGIVDDARAIVDRLRRPVPVPLTAVWSRSDGIVPWRGCVVDESTDPVPAENVEVVSSHVGMVANPIPLAVVVDRLRQDPADWQPFSWRRLFPEVRAG
jgi:pimeloyl-ACP methyl ester carboxylesterase